MEGGRSAERNEQKRWKLLVEMVDFLEEPFVEQPITEALLQEFINSTFFANLLSEQVEEMGDNERGEGGEGDRGALSTTHIHSDEGSLFQGNHNVTSEEKDEDPNIMREKEKEMYREGSSSLNKRWEESGVDIGVTCTAIPINIPLAGGLADKKKVSELVCGEERSPTGSTPPPNCNASECGGDASGSRKSASSVSPSPTLSSTTHPTKSRSDERGGRKEEPLVTSHHHHQQHLTTNCGESCQGRSSSSSGKNERVGKYLEKEGRNIIDSLSSGSRRWLSSARDADKYPKRTIDEFMLTMELTLAGKWTPQLQHGWNMLEQEEAVFMKEFGEKSKRLKATPDRHPAYAPEWAFFWQNRLQLISEGKDEGERQDVVGEWTRFWKKRLQQLLIEEYEESMDAIKVRHGMDERTLRKLLNAPNLPQTAPPNLPRHVEILPPTQEPAPPPTEQLATGLSKSVSSLVQDMNTRSEPISNVEATVSQRVTSADILSRWNTIRCSDAATCRQGSSSTCGNCAVCGPPPANEPLSCLARSSKEMLDGGAKQPEPRRNGVTKILGLLAQLKNELDWLCPKVEEYHLKAKQLDLERVDQSYNLLKDEHLVALLFQIQHLLMSRYDPSKNQNTPHHLHYALYALNDILPDCQTIRRANNVEIEERPARSSSTPSTNHSVPTCVPPSFQQNDMPTRMEGDRKKQVYVLLSGLLLNRGRDNPSDEELGVLIREMCPNEAPISTSTLITPPPCINNWARGGPLDRTQRTLANGKTQSTPHFPHSPNQPNVESMSSGCSPGGDEPQGRRSPFSSRNFVGNPEPAHNNNHDNLTTNLIGTRGSCNTVTSGREAHVVSAHSLPQPTSNKLVTTRKK